MRMRCWTPIRGHFFCARESLERAVRGERKRDAKSQLLASAPKATLAKMGAFVTLNDRTTGALRGCIGEILPLRPLVEAVAVRAVDAALHDPSCLSTNANLAAFALRFPP